MIYTEEQEKMVKVASEGMLMTRQLYFQRILPKSLGFTRLKCATTILRLQAEWYKALGKEVFLSLLEKETPWPWTKEGNEELTEAMTPHYFGIIEDGTTILAEKIAWTTKSCQTLALKLDTFMKHVEEFKIDLKKAKGL